jgi:hypothetical protein
MNDIEKLIEYIKDHSNNYLGSKATLKEIETFEYMYDLLIGTLEKQLSGGWIPVSERLPKEDEEVLITLAHGKVCWAFLYLGEWNTGISTYPIDCVTAWMPLPEPYKEVENE